MTRDEIREKVQDEALSTVLPLKRAGVGASMGVGKTLIGLRHMAAHYSEHARFLLAGPKTNVYDEWVDEAKKHKLEYLIPHIRFTTYLSLNKQDHDYDVLYLDECHSLLYTHEIFLSQYHGKILGLTGTPPRSQRSEKYRMVFKYCPIVYEYETDEAVEAKILNDYKIIVHFVDLDPTKTMKVEKKGKSWYTSEQATYDYWSGRIDSAVGKKEQQIMSVMRMKAMMDFPSKEVAAAKLLASTNEKCLVFANTQEQADRLCTYSYHSNNQDSKENLQKFKSGEITKLSAVLQLSEGVNIPNLREGIILHAYGNERKSAQRIGRLLRLNPDDVATIHILCYRNTVDERWVRSALESFDSSKITWIG